MSSRAGSPPCMAQKKKMRCSQDLPTSWLQFMPVKPGEQIVCALQSR